MLKVKNSKNMKKSILMMTLLAGLVLVSSCASKKELEECRQRNLGMMQSYKEMNLSYQEAK
jgi:chemotaxis protein MotB